MGLTPGDNLPWIVDKANPVELRLRTVTPLLGRDTWVHQVAAPPDGSRFVARGRHEVLIRDSRSLEVTGSPRIPNGIAASTASPGRPTADTNNDGLVAPADFNAWIVAFNRGASGAQCPA